MATLSAGVQRAGGSVQHPMGQLDDALEFMAAYVEVREYHTALGHLLHALLPIRARIIEVLEASQALLSICMFAPDQASKRQDI